MISWVDDNATEGAHASLFPNFVLLALLLFHNDKNLWMTKSDENN